MVSASYGVVGRWREDYDDLDHERAASLLVRGGRRAPRRPHLRHPQRGGAQAGADRAGADDRPRAAAARRAGRRPRPRRPRGPRLDALGARLRPRLAGDGAGLPPRRGDPARLHPRAAAARGPGGRRRPRSTTSSPRRTSRATFGMPLRAQRTRTAGGRAARTAGTRGPPTDRVGAWTGSGTTCGQAWLALAAVLGVAEMFSLDLILLMLAVGAVVGMLTAPARRRLSSLQVLVAGGRLGRDAGPGPADHRRAAAHRPRARARPRQAGRPAGRRHRADHVLEPGRIKLAGEIWSAAPYDETLTIAPGETVEVFEIKGADGVRPPGPDPRVLTGPNSIGRRTA